MNSLMMTVLTVLVVVLAAFAVGLAERRAKRPAVLVYVYLGAILALTLLAVSL